MLIYTHICEVCTCEFETLVDMEWHMETEHEALNNSSLATDEIPLDVEEMLTCMVCGLDFET